MSLPYLSVVRLASDVLRDQGVEPGALGVIVDVYDDGAYEVEFSDQDGITIALCPLGRDDLELVSSPEALTVSGTT